MTIDSKYTTQKSIKDIIKLENQRANFKIKCKNCGHIISMIDADRTICSHCQHWVYRTPLIEFKYKMKTEMRKANDRSKKNSTQKMATKK